MLPRIRFAISVVLGLALGCGGATPPRTDDKAKPVAKDRLTQAEMVELCVTLHQKAAVCPGEFTDLNIDLRAKYVPEFARMVADPETRAKMRAAGIAETAADAANARERCEEFAQPAWGEPQPRGDLARLDTCYAIAECAGKMTCLRPIIEPRFAYRASHGEPH